MHIFVTITDKMHALNRSLRGSTWYSFHSLRFLRAGSPAATSRTSAPLNMLIYLELYLPRSQRESLKTPLPLLLLSLLTKRLAVHKESMH